MTLACCARPAPPVVIDLETRSACDLRVGGGAAYARDSSTRILTAAWTADMGETYSVWLPGCESIPADYVATHFPGVTIHLRQPGDRPPDALRDLTSRPWVCHNSWTFDREVWQQLMPREFQPVEWIDTYPLALSIGLPGGLNKIGMQLWGQGKYDDGHTQMLKYSKAKDEGVCSPLNVPLLGHVLVGRYNVQDVKLNADLYKFVRAERQLPVSEQKVLKAHDAVNSRGVRIDRKLVVALINLANESRAYAVDQIVELTEGALPDQKAIQNPAKVKDWLTKMGCDIGSSIRKEIVARYIYNHDVEDDADGDESDRTDDDTFSLIDMPRIVKVLELRMQAVRITSGKLNTALQSLIRTGGDDEHPVYRAFHLYAYWAAHTGRWGGRRIQLHNLPRGKEGVDVWQLIKDYEATGKLTYAGVKASLPTDKKLYRFLGVDDAASALIRSIIIPDEGQTLATADLSNIEARILAWLVGEKWLMDAFWSGADPYIKMAEKIFGPSARWPKFPDPKKPGCFLPIKKHPYRQVGKVVVLGSGYQLGRDSFKLYAIGQGIDLDSVGVTPSECIDSYRRMHPKIAGIEKGVYDDKPWFRGGVWCQYQEAALAAWARKQAIRVGRITFQPEGSNLHVILPSGRRLIYRSIQVRMKQRNSGAVGEVLSYLSHRYGRVDMYGGKWTENIVQAVARDVQAFGIVLCEEEGLPVVLHTHDEIGSSIEESRFPDFMRCVTTPPDWLDGFPLDAEGGCAPRYAKAAYATEELWRNGRKHK